MSIYNYVIQYGHYFLIVMIIIYVLQYKVNYFHLLYLYISDFIKSRGQKKRFYGIEIYTGLPGSGKTMALVNRLDEIRRNHDVYIFTNFGYIYQDDDISKLSDIVGEYDKPVIFGIDELQNEFNSREFIKFPKELVQSLTQCRKGNGYQLLATTQHYEFVDKTFRELAEYVHQCHCSFNNRLVNVARFDGQSYKFYLQTANLDKKKKIWKYKYKFIQTDYLRGLYDTLQRVKLMQRDDLQPSKKHL